MTVYVEARINNRYDIILPDFRKTFHEVRPDWEKGRLESCAELMKPGMVVYDIGAEHGDFTALYKKWVSPGKDVGHRSADGTLTYGDGEVIPVEPAAHYWPFIFGTFQANGFGCPSHSWVALVGDQLRKNGGHYSGIWPDQAFGEGIPDGGFIHLAQDSKAPRVSIDTMARLVKPDAIVMDIEGAEGFALKGARKTMEFYRPLIWVSWHEETAWNWYRTKLDDIRQIAARADYDMTALPHYGEGETFWLLSPR